MRILESVQCKALTASRTRHNYNFASQTYTLGHFFSGRIKAELGHFFCCPVSLAMSAVEYNI